jgi:hypothetical protein
MRAPGLCNTPLGFPPRLLLLLLLLAFAAAKQSKVSVRPKITRTQQQVKGAREPVIPAVLHHQQQHGEEFQGLPGEVEYEVDLTDQTRPARPAFSFAEADSEVTWIAR